jgi:hypothetical protein
MPDNATHDPQATAAPPATVVPRWEWRLIARSLPFDRARLSFAPGPPKVSSETYLLSSRSPHNIKVRGGVLEIKRLQQRATDGLEQWRPTARSTFPLDADTRVELWDAWAIAAPPGLTAVPSLPDLVREVVSPHPELRQVDLVKHRTRLSLAGCNGELVELEIAGERWISVAFEDADPALVRAAAASLGIDVRTNLNYPAALKRIVGLPPLEAPEKEGVR